MLAGAGGPGGVAPGRGSSRAGCLCRGASRQLSKRPSEAGLGLGVLTTIKKKGRPPAAALGGRAAPRPSVCAQALPSAPFHAPPPAASRFSLRSRLGSVLTEQEARHKAFVPPDGSTYAAVSLAPG